MIVQILVAAKAPAACKTRLRATLGDAGCEALVATMLHRVVAAAQAVVGAPRVAVVGPHRHGLPAAVPLIADAGGGLDGAIAGALDRIAADRVVILPADLPHVVADEIAALAALPPGAIGIAPDRAGAGTNALSLPLPAAAGFRFAYGAGSFARHRDEAARLHLAVVPVCRPGLAFDVDRPADLAGLDA